MWTHKNRLKAVIAVQSHPHVGRLLGVRLRKSASVVWVSAQQQFLSPSPQAERGVGGEVGDGSNPTPNPSPLAGRGETAGSIHRQLGGAASRLSFAARELRRHATGAEELLWERLQARQLNGAKFRRQHPLGANYIVDFYCAAAKLAIELDGSIHDSDLATWSDGIRHRQIQLADVRILRFRNDEVVTNLDHVLNVITEELTRSTETADIWLRADQLFAGCSLVSDETGTIDVVKLIEFEFANETLFSLTIEEDHSFITSGGVARG
ncbi:MAG TPA: endonuclease domain-containing protein [Pyrinomonadaceae bacterium]|nr:endonuclease domain-containing protein [Pyrinomonadaceae bacterium]